MIANNSKLRAVGYIRVSGKKQTKKYSLPSQIERIENYCKDKYDLQNIYREEGISGKTVKKRGAFQEVVRDGFAGKFDVLIVLWIDRFTRDIETGVASYWGLKNQGIKIVALEDGFDSDSDDIQPLIKIYMADKYRQQLIANIKRGHKKKLSGGDPRIGHQSIAREWDEVEKKFKLKYDEAKEWRDVAEQFLAGVSADKLAELAKERKSKTVPTTAVNIRRHLRNSLGDTHTINYDGELFTFPCEPIVNKATRDAIVKLMDKRRHAPHRKPYKFLLTGDIYCKDCGNKLQPFSTTGNKRHYYYHSGRNGCTGLKLIPVKHIDEAVVKECFLFFGVDKKAYEKAIKEHLPDAGARKKIQSDIKNLKRQLSKSEKDKDVILDKVLNEDLNSSIIDGLNQRANDLDKRIDSTSEELKEKEHRLSSMMTVEEYKATSEKIRSEWHRVFTGFDTLEEMPWQNRKYLIDQMFDGVDEDGRPFGVYVRNVECKVFEYELYGRFTEGTLFTKKEDSDYYGPETEAALSKSYSLEMGDTAYDGITIQL